MSKINDIQVRPIQLGSGDKKKKIRNKDMFELPFCNTLICARKNSGKTNLVYNIMEKSVDKNCNVMIFSGTHNLDPLMGKMKDMLKKKGCKIMAEDSFIDIDSGINYLMEYIDHEKELAELDQKDESDDENIVEADPIRQLFNIAEPMKKKAKKPKKRESKYITPKTIIVIDDLSYLLRDPSIFKVLIQNRHYHLKVIICCHSAKNLEPRALEQIDYSLILPNLADDQVLHIGEKMGMLGDSRDVKKMPWFLKRYHDATDSGKYNFLYVDKPRMSYRKCFNIRLD